MIGYVMIGTNDLPRATAFYDELLKEIGASRYLTSDKFVAWSSSPGSTALAVTKPHDGNAATVGNGVMIALGVASAAQVDALHRKAIALGARDEGAPGQRGEHFYIGYFRDLDGNKLNFFHLGA